MRNVRAHLDVIAGGPQLAVVGAAAHLMAENGIDMAANLQTQLAALCDAEGYDVVLIDSGPGDVPLLDTYLSVANYLLIPTRDDQASLGGVERLARRFWRARKRGASIQLLGVLLFDVNPRAVKRNEEVFAQVSEMLEGSGTTPFDVTIRSAPAAAVDMRTLHKTAGELVALAHDERRSRLSKLRDKESPTRGLWTSDPSGLAADYQELVRQIVARLVRYESAGVPRSRSASDEHRSSKAQAGLRSIGSRRRPRRLVAGAPGRRRGAAGRASRRTHRRGAGDTPRGRAPE